MANQAVVGVLRTLVTADVAQFDTSMRKVSQTVVKFGQETLKLTQQGERLAKAFSGDKLLASANQLTGAITKLGGANGLLAGASKLTENEQRRVNTQLTEAIAKYTALGQKAPQAILDLEQATRKLIPPTEQLATTLTASTAASGGMSKGITSLITQFGRYIGPLAIGGAILKTLDYAESLEKASIALGTTSAATQRLENVAVGANTTLEALTTAITMMQDRLAGGDTAAIKALEDLGLTVEQVFALNPDQQFILIARALQEIASKEKQIALGKDIFGRGFIEIIGTVRGDIDKLVDSVTVLSNTTVDRLNETEGAWDRLKLAASRYFAFIQDNAATLLMDPFGSHGARMGPFAPLVSPDLPRGPGLPTISGALPGGPTLDEIKALEASGAALQQRFEHLKALGNDLFGRDIIARAHDLAAVIGPIANVTKLSEEAQAEVNRTVIAALQVYARLGEEAPAHLQKLEAATRALGDTTKEHRAFLNFIGEREIQDEAQRLAAIEVADRAHRQFQNQLGEQELRDHEANLRAQADADAQYRQFQNRIGEQAIEDEKNRQEQITEQLEEATRRRQQIIDMFTMPISDAFANMLTGLRGFKDGFLDIWRSIQRGFANILAEMLDTFIGGFLKGMMNAIGGQAFGGGGGGGGLANLAGGALPGLLGGGGGAFTTINAAGLPVTPGLAGAGAPGGAGALGFLSNPAFWTNPYTIAGIAAAAVLTWGITKKGWFRGGEEGVQVNPRRDKFQMQFARPGESVAEAGQRIAAQLTTWTGQPGGGSLWRNFQRADSVKEFERAQAGIVAEFKKHGTGLKSFAMGGFVPPGVNQLAMLHGGAMGELVMPVAKMTDRQQHIVQNHYWTVQGWDGADIGRVMEREVWPRFRREMSLNQHGGGTSVRRASTVTP